MESDVHPPRWASWVVSRGVHPVHQEEVLGDFEESYRDRYRQGRHPEARWWYWSQVLRSLGPFILFALYWNTVMLKNYLKIALRSLRKQKGYALINIGGLAVGMACAVLILVWIADERSYDRFHENAPSLYRVEKDQRLTAGRFHTFETPHPIGPAFKAELPEVIEAARVRRLGGMRFRTGAEVFYANNLVAVDPSFLRLFSFPLTVGDPATVLSEPFSLVLTETAALRHFGSVDPVGQVIEVDGTHDLTVTGVLKDLPRTSSLQFDMLVPFEFSAIVAGYSDNWENNAIQTFIQMRPGSQVAAVEAKMTRMLHARVTTTETSYTLMPLTHLRLFFAGGFNRTSGRAKYVYSFSMIALFVLLIACCNFMNLATARSIQRAKEIGVRKVMGAARRTLIWQFLGEALLISFVALVLALGLVLLLLPPFNDLAQKDIPYALLTEGWILAGMVLIALGTGVLSGSYPALFLSGFQPAKVLKGHLRSGNAGLRKTLVVVQFGLSIFLIIGTGVVYSQMMFMKNKELGYNEDHVVYVRMRGEGRDAYETLKAEWRSNAAIISVSSAQFRPFSTSTTRDVDWPGKDPNLIISVGYNSVDFGFTETLEIDLLQGRSFSEAFPTDVLTQEGGLYVVNEAMARLMGSEGVVGMPLTFQGIPGQVIGVVEDFHFRNFQMEIGPLVMYVYPGRFSTLLARVRPEDMAASIAFMQETWDRLVPGYPFDYGFLDESASFLYQSEERMSRLLGYFTVLAVLIACLGLFGLASFTATQRTREVGIRKVFGASVGNIVFMLSKGFALLILMAFVCAAPAAYYAMDQWLEAFAYRVELNGAWFVASGVLALLVGGMTIGYQALRAALARPVESLRHE